MGPTTPAGFRDAADRYLRPQLGPVPIPRLGRRTLPRHHAPLGAGGVVNGRPLSPGAVNLAHAVVRRALNDAHSTSSLSPQPSGRTCGAAGSCGA